MSWSFRLHGAAIPKHRACMQALACFHHVRLKRARSAPKMTVAAVLSRLYLLNRMQRSAARPGAGLTTWPRWCPRC